ncbi:MAG: sulfite exporter TauE/SafE family protein [Ignavibacteria bacterium]|nr:sulfite exporter TauE/SafE family protein [Ignavibacteria bacterium]
MFELYTALTIGLIGSFHCIGMCGPIAIALPLGKKSWLNRITGGIIYNLGRTITYGLLGAIFGFLGKGIHMAGFQQWTSILLGAIMIASVFFPFLFRGKFDFNRMTIGLSGKLVSQLRILFGKQSKSNLFLIGLLNGLLPCGLVYVAIAGAINTNDVLLGILFMVVFGLGTLPIMLSVSMVGNLISSSLKQKMNKILPVFIVILGIIFILRGLSLGIPFISPKSQMLTPEKEVKVKGACCTPEKTHQSKAADFEEKVD